MYVVTRYTEYLCINGKVYLVHLYVISFKFCNTFENTEININTRKPNNAETNISYKIYIRIIYTSLNIAWDLSNLTTVTVKLMNLALIITVELGH